MISLLLRVHLLGSDIKAKMAEMHSESHFMNLLCFLHFFPWECDSFGITGITEKSTTSRVSYRVGKCDKVNLSLTEILGVFDPQLRGNCFNFCKVGGNIFIHFCCCRYCWTCSQKGRPGVLPEAWWQFGIICRLQNYVQWSSCHRNVVVLIFGCEKKDKQNNETVYQILNGHQIKPNFSFISTGAILNPYLNSHVKFFSILFLIIIQDVTY